MTISEKKEHCSARLNILGGFKRALWWLALDLSILLHEPLAALDTGVFHQVFHVEPPSLRPMDEVIVIHQGALLS